MSMCPTNLIHSFLTICKIVTFKIDEKLACGKMQKAILAFLKL
jgi:hypothetical protein